MYISLCVSLWFHLSVSSSQLLFRSVSPIFLPFSLSLFSSLSSSFFFIYLSLFPLSYSPPCVAPPPYLFLPTLLSPLHQIAYTSLFLSFSLSHFSPALNLWESESFAGCLHKAAWSRAEDNVSQSWQGDKKWMWCILYIFMCVCAVLRGTAIKPSSMGFLSASLSVLEELRSQESAPLPYLRSGR